MLWRHLNGHLSLLTWLNVLNRQWVVWRPLRKNCFKFVMPGPGPQVEWGNVLCPYIDRKRFYIVPVCI